MSPAARFSASRVRWRSLAPAVAPNPERVAALALYHAVEAFLDAPAASLEERYETHRRAHAVLAALARRLSKRGLVREHLREAARARRQLHAIYRHEIAMMRLRGLLVGGGL